MYPQKTKREVGHTERLRYWAEPGNAAKLEFLTAGPEIAVPHTPWEKGSEEAHLERLIAWCRGNGFECVSVPLTKSEKNPTALHVEMTVIPELQPTHLYEPGFARGGTRWQTVPKGLGFTPRHEMFADEPHPFV